MEVQATRRGFDGLRLRGVLAHNDNYEPDVFDFTGFRIDLDKDGEIKHNLGSWMELTKKGEQQFKKAMKAFEKANAKALAKAEKEKSQKS